MDGGKTKQNHLEKKKLERQRENCVKSTKNNGK